MPGPATLRPRARHGPKAGLPGYGEVQRSDVGRTARVRRRGGAGFDRIGDIDA